MEKFIILRAYDVAQFAYLDAAKLGDEGITSRIQDENMVGMIPFLSPVMGGVKLLVREHDSGWALEILNEPPATLPSDVDIPDDEQTDRCLNCGSKEYVNKGSIPIILVSFILGILPFAIPVRRRHCTQCGHSWT